MSERRYTAAEVDAAVDALRAPERLAHAQEVISHAAPSLQRVLGAALDAGGWFGAAHDAELARVSSAADEQERLVAVRTLVAEETRLGMLVGAAIGFELARELQATQATGPDGETSVTPNAEER